MKTEIELDRRFCIGLFLVGALSHYSSEEIQKHKDINYILMTLQKKNYPLKNGTADNKLWSEQYHVLNQIRKAPKKREQFEARFKRETLASMDRINYWAVHSEIADKSWKRAADIFNSEIAITVNQLVAALLRKDEATMKYYKFNPKKLEKFSKTGVSGHIFASSKVATELLRVLDEEISCHNYNKNKKVA